VFLDLPPFLDYQLSVGLKQSEKFAFTQRGEFVCLLCSGVCLQFMLGTRSLSISASGSLSGRSGDSRFEFSAISSKSVIVNSSSAAGTSSMDVVGSRLHGSDSELTLLHQQTSGDHKMCLEPGTSSTSGGHLDELVRAASEVAPLHAASLLGPEIGPKV